MQKTYINTAIIGGGVIGLAIGRAISSREEVAIFEKEKVLGSHASSRNSEVIHSGIYYKNNTLKSRMCIEGNKLLYEYLKLKKLQFKRCGKLLVATNKFEMNQLNYLKQNAKNLNIEFCKTPINDPSFIALNRIKDSITVLSTGIFNAHEFIASLELDIIRNNSHILLDSNITKITAKKNYFELMLNNQPEDVITCSNLINCSGFNSYDLYKHIFPESDLNIRFFKGHYYKYHQSKLNLSIDKLIYPMPERHGLGIHLTFDLDGNIKFGPNVEEISKLDYSFQDSEQRRDLFYDAISKYLPIQKDLLEPDYTGIRIKYFDSKGNNDFKICSHRHNSSLFINLIGIDSPGLTSSLAIAKSINNQLISNY